MSLHAVLRGLLACIALAGFPAQAAAQAFPSKPVTIVVPFGAGGVADITARTYGEAMAASLGQPVVIENRPDAGNVAGSTAVARAAPDGHTLLLVSNANAVSARLFKQLPYDPVGDFAPVGLLATFDLAFVVGPQSPFRSLADVLAHARAQPGRLTIGTIAAGSTQNLAAELFKTTAAIDALIVPYDVTPALQAALLTGQVDVGIEVLAPMLSQLGGDKGMRVLAVTSDQRFAGLSGVPTVQEAGLAGYTVTSWNGLAAPAGTPATVIGRLNAAIVDAARSPAVRERLQSLGVRVQASDPQALAQLLASEIRRWGEVIERARVPRQ